MKTRRFATARCKINGTPASYVKKYCDEFYFPNNFPVGGYLAGCRRDDIRYSLGAAAMAHWGFPTPKSATYYLNLGTDVFVDYFCGDWWRADKESARELDRSKKGARLHWWSPFADGILQALLIQRVDDIRRCAEWITPNVKPEPQDADPFLAKLYKCIALQFRNEAAAGKKLEQDALQSKYPQTRLLTAAWIAARAGETDEFRANVIKALRNFTSRTIRRPTPLSWLDQHTAAVVAAAELCFNIGISELPEELEAVLISRSSLGLSTTALAAKKLSTSKQPEEHPKKNLEVAGFLRLHRPLSARAWGELIRQSPDVFPVKSIRVMDPFLNRPVDLTSGRGLAYIRRKKEIVGALRWSPDNSGIEIYGPPKLHSAELKIGMLTLGKFETVPVKK